MRAISLVNRVEFDYRGNVVKNGIAVGDVDNDGHNELVVGSGNGNLTIFKGRECIQVIPGLGFITCVAIGDIFNEKRNCLVVITGDGWCYIFDTIIEIEHETAAADPATEPATETIDADLVDKETDRDETTTEDSVDTVDGQMLSSENSDPTEDTTGETNSDSNSNTVKSESSVSYPQWIKVFSQRIPANTKDALLEDIDGDDSIELVLGLTDRVVRSYRWCPNHPPSTASGSFTTKTSTELNHTSSDSDQEYDQSLPTHDNSSCSEQDKIKAQHQQQQRCRRRRYRYRRRSGKLICQNKWECARQVGSLSVQTLTDGTPALMVAQPGGTFMRIRSMGEDGMLSVGRLARIGVRDGNVGKGDADGDADGELDVERSVGSTSTTSENLTGSAIDYQFLNVAHMRNPNISTEILGNLRSKTAGTDAEDTAKDDEKLPYPYVVATLDGAIMLVRDEIVLRSIAVDQQIFNLSKLDITGDGSDNVIACSWSGQTYILDQQMNGVLFQLGESVQTFESGHYTLDEDNVDVTCLIYVTFNNKILLYYDIPLKEINCKRYELPHDYVDKLIFEEGDKDNARSQLRQLTARGKRELVQYLLYSVKKG